MTKLFQQRESRNYWINKNQIPLGNVPESESTIFKIMPKISDSLVMGAMTGRGKSVIFRNINWFVANIRPCIVFDWEGEDHKLSHYANKQPINLPPHTAPSRVPNSLFFSYPSPSIDEEDVEKYEVKVVPNLNNYSSDELRGLGFPTGASMELKRTLKHYGPFDDLMELHTFIKCFPTNARESSIAYRHREDYKRPFDEFDTIPSQTKQSLLKYLYSVIEKNLFALTNKRVPYYIKLLKQGKNIFLNFNGFVDLARVEISKVLKEVIKFRKKNPEDVAPALFYEEADRIIPRVTEDSEERKKIEYIKSELVNSSLRARKLKIAQYFNTPSLYRLDKTIIDNSNEKIFGEMRGYDLAEVKRCTNDSVMYMVSRLKFNRYKNIREFVFRNEFKNTFKFVPYECPQEMHRE